MLCISSLTTDYYYTALHAALQPNAALPADYTLSMLAALLHTALISGEQTMHQLNIV